MNLYHGSTEIVKKTELRKGTRNLDFGGWFFYATSSFSQAKRWAETKAICIASFPYRKWSCERNNKKRIFKRAL